MSEDLIKFISKERLIPYLKLSNSNLEKALKLYEYNIRLNKSFYVPLHNIEICIRNTFHKTIADKYGNEWYYNSKLLLGTNKQDKTSLSRVEESLSRVRKKKEFNIHDIIANLSLGFWSALLHPNHEIDIWRPCLRKIFSLEEKITRHDIYTKVYKIKYFRNRIAHYECNLKRDFKGIHKMAYDLLNVISSEITDWTEAYDDFEEIYKEYEDFKKSL